MRKTIFTLGLMLAAALSLTSCSKNEEANFTPEVQVPFELFANLESRTTNDGMSTKWANGDQINVFHAVAGTTEYVNDTPFVEADNTGTPFVTDGTGTFTGTLSEELDQTKAYDWYALYPYKSYITTPAEQTEGYVYIGSKSNEVQTQNGNDSMAHIAGKNYPLVGVVKNVPASEKPAITMSHISSLVEFNVTNTLDEDITVTAIRLTSVEDIVGSYYINFAGDDVGYKNHTEYWSATATLEVKNGTPIKKGESAKFYMAIKPHSVDDDFLKVEVDATAATGNGTFSKSYSDVTTSFVAGKIKTIKVNFNAEFEAETGLPLPFEEKFDEGQGDFTIDNVNIGSLSYVWKHDSSYKYMKASAYVSGSRYETESWLISPLIAIPAETAANPILTFENAINYTSTPKNSLSLKVYADGEWNDVTIPNLGTGSSWNWVSSGDINLSTYKGKNIKFAFVYTSTATEAATVEIKNVVLEVRKLSQVLSFPEAAYTVKIGDTFTAPELSGAKTTVTYTSSNTDVATVNATSGAISLGSTAGSTVITATAEENDSYNSATATYTIVLEDASIETESETIDFSAKNYSNGVEIASVSGTSFKVTFNKGTNSNAPKYYTSGTAVRVYGGGYFTVSSDYTITKIELTFGSSDGTNAISVNGGTYSNGIWTGESKSVTFTVNGSTGNRRIKTIEVTYIVSDDVVVKESQTLSFPQNAYSVVEDDTFDAPTVIGAQTDVTYTSSNTAVATVDANTGVVTILSTGETTITATAVEDDTYQEASASYTLTVTPKPVETDGTYTLLTNLADLKVGDKIVIAAKDYNYALSTNQKSNNRGQAAITKSGSTITFGSDVQIITVEAGTADATYAFNTGSGYLYAASSSSNNLKTTTDLDGNGSWTITIDADGTADVKAQGTNTRNVMQYNQSSSLFACYSSASQNAIVIYRLVE